MKKVVLSFNSTSYSIIVERISTDEKVYYSLTSKNPIFNGFLNFNLYCEAREFALKILARLEDIDVNVKS